MFTYLCNKFPFFREIKIFTIFFLHAPALYLSLWALFGHLVKSTSNPLFLFPLLPLLLHEYKQVILGFVFFILFFAAAPEEPGSFDAKGFGIFSIREIQEQKGKLLLKGALQVWNDQPLRITVSTQLKKEVEKQIAFHETLLCKGILKKTNRFHLQIHRLEPTNYSKASIPWHRFYFKQKMQKWMEKGHPNGPVLSSLLFGSPIPKQIANSIKRFGLSHLFAISGFHFNLITTLFALLLRPFISYRAFHWTILTLLIFYALLIGPNPSLLRGFLAQALLFLGLSLQREAFGMNSIGVALFFILLFFPDMIHSLGFIFSFLITFTLLLFFPLVQTLFPKKPSFLMDALALLLTVELASFPLNLTLFGTYPLLSLLYNLFVTPLISCTLFLSPLTLIPYLSTLIYLPMDLALWTFEVPSSIDIWIHYPLPLSFCLLYFTLLFSGGIVLSHLKKLDYLSNFGGK